MFISKSSIFFPAAVLSISVAGCNVLEKGVVEDTPQNRVENRGFGGPFDKSNDSITGENGFLSNVFGGGNGSASGSVLPVNKYLWRASLDTLSFLPLASTDPFSGVIATEWGASPESQNERVRVTARVDGKELTARALDVAVFRETLTPAGAWVTASVNPATAQQVKDNILQRARELRINDIDGPKI